jgi:hypothetical protein
MEHNFERPSTPNFYTTGRPPWFNVDIPSAPGELTSAPNSSLAGPNSPRHGFKFESTDAFIIGICGGSASGKTSVSE